MSRTYPFRMTGALLIARNKKDLAKATRSIKLSKTARLVLFDIRKVVPPPGLNKHRKLVNAVFSAVRELRGGAK